MKTLVLVNTLTEVNSFVYANHIDFFMKSQRLVPDNQFFFYTPHRMSIDRARNQAALQAMKLECDYLMFLDDDVLVPPDTFKKLLDAKKDVVAGLVIIRGMPFNVMAFRAERDSDNKITRNILGNMQLKFFNDLPLINKCEDGHLTINRDCPFCWQGIKTNLVEIAPCEALGFSCCLINMDVVRAMEPPYFITGPNYTEDVFFCLKALESLSPVPEIALHTGIRCGHLMPPEPVEFDTIPLFKGFYDGLSDLEKAQLEHYKRMTGVEQVSGERNLDYIKRCLATL